MNFPYLMRNGRQMHMMNMGGFGGGPFSITLQAYSTVFLSDRARPNAESGGKILLPESVLEHLVEQGGIMLFKLTNKKTSRTTHSGVLEFVQETGKRCYLPRWMMNNLLLKDGDEIFIESIKLPTARFARFEPQSTDFLDISNPKAVLEKALRDFSCLTKNDIISIPYLNKDYELRVLELKPENAVTIIECDMEVDFAPPVGYVEPKFTPSASQNIAGTPKTSNPLSMTPGADPLLGTPSSFKSPSTFLPFHGQGNRLNGKTKSKDFEQPAINPSLVQARGIPNYDYEYGTLQFIRTPLRQMNDEANSNEKSNTASFQPFTGAGNMLKPNQRPK